MNDPKIDDLYEYVRRDVEASHYLSNEFNKIAEQLKRSREAQQQFEKINDIHNSNQPPLVPLIKPTGSQQI